MNYGLRIIIIAILCLNFTSLFAQKKARLVHKFNDGSRNVYCFFSDSTFQYADFAGCTDQIMGSGVWSQVDSSLVMRYSKGTCPTYTVSESSTHESENLVIIYKDAYGRKGKWQRVVMYVKDKIQGEDTLYKQAALESSYNTGVVTFKKSEFPFFAFTTMGYIDKEQCEYFRIRESVSDTLFVKMNYCWEVIAKLNTKTHIENRSYKEEYVRRGSDFYEVNGHRRLRK